MGAYVSSVIISKFDLETAHRAKMQIAAEYCAPSPPSFIADVLSQFSFDVYSQDSIDKISLTRKEASLLIAERGTTAVNFVDALRNPSFRDLLATNSDMGSEVFLDDFAGALSKYAAFSRQALNSPQLVGANGTIRAGRGRALLPGMMPAKYVCAAVIAEVIAVLGKLGRLAPSKRDMWASANELWTSWIPSKSWGDDPLTAWKRYFETAGDARLQPIRKEVRRLSSILAASAENN
jgi:hypothetical protein